MLTLINKNNTTKSITENHLLKLSDHPINVLKRSFDNELSIYGSIIFYTKRIDSDII